MRVRDFFYFLFCIYCIFFKLPSSGPALVGTDLNGYFLHGHVMRTRLMDPSEVKPGWHGQALRRGRAFWTTHDIQQPAAGLSGILLVRHPPPQ